MHLYRIQFGVLVIFVYKSTGPQEVRDKSLNTKPYKMADDSLRTASFRQSVVSNIDKEIRQSTIRTSRNSMEMENHIFQKAKSKEEYLAFVARLILHIREMNAKKGCEINEQGPVQGNMQTNMQPNPSMAMDNRGPMPNQMAQIGGQIGQMGGEIPNAEMGQMFGELPNQLQAQVGGPLDNQVPNVLQG